MKNKNLFRKGVLIILILVLLIIPSYAYIPFKYNNGLRYKFYGKNINETKCYDIFNSIEEKYTQNIKYIKIFSENSNRNILGAYWWYTKSIDLFDGCTKKVIIHELSHHCQYEKGDNLYNGFRHNGNFYDCEEEIWQNIN